MTLFFNAFHAPIGAHASFTLGCRGRKGGLGLEMGGPAQENVYIGLESADGTAFEALPFFEPGGFMSSRYDHSAESQKPARAGLQEFAAESISRRFAAGTDCWQAGDLTCTLFSHGQAAPCPETAPIEQQKQVYCPAVTAELTIDNRQGQRTRRAFIGYTAGNSMDSMHLMEQLPAPYCGIAKGNSTAMVTHAAGAIATQGFCPADILTEDIPANHHLGLGDTGLLIFEAPAREQCTFQVAICFYRGGIVTSGEATSYWYTRFFESLEQVGVYTLDAFADNKKAALETDERFEASHLNDHQRFQLAHAIRSYYGSTQLLDWDGKAFWVVNEGEYRMMNTFDLTVDQLFFEMKQNPWTVRNELDMFVNRYSYTDTVHFPGEDNEHAGGISFTHDMGRCNHISRPRYSTYELFNLSGCFSHMTHEQLVNWVLCASVYVKQTQDQEWLQANLPVCAKCMSSMLNRDHPDPDQRNGVMSLDSSRTMSGSEITTYDSLDQSLGQSRNNVYMAVKCWASYVAMAELFQENQRSEESQTCLQQAQRAASTISSHLDQDGFIPAILGEDCNAKIIPAIEGLVFPAVLGQREALAEDGPYGNLIKALKTHLTSILKPGICLFPDNGWKLSSSADNSWLSKIYLCQYVARQILGIRTPQTGELADQAHRRWLLKEENLFFAWSDQMVSGVARGSKYYPRGVTSILWLDETS